MPEYRYDHIHLRSPDPNATARFFETMFGAEVRRDAAVMELRAKGAEIAVGPVMRNPGLYLAFVRGPEGVMVELVQR